VSKTLQDAFEGLMTYWQGRPQGGSKAELMALAAQKGFKEPLLDEWLSVFLRGLKDVGLLEGEDYDTDLVPQLQKVGTTRAIKAARTIYNQQLAQGGDLRMVDLQLKITQAGDKVAHFVSRLAAVDSAQVWVAGNVTAGSIKTEATEAIERHHVYLTRQLQSELTGRAQLVEEMDYLQSALG
jgi:hypothetical protein